VKVKLRLPEAAALYGLVLTFIFVFFLLGLFIGKSPLVEAKPKVENIPVMDVPVQDVKPQLEFYDRLMEPAEMQTVPGFSEAEATAQTEDSSPELVGEEERVPSDVYTVQVGALTVEEDASRMLLRLTAKGYSAQLRTPSAEDHYYRIWVGRFETAEQAREMERVLREDGFLTYLKKTN
jgi:cell division septation protein DedD